MLFEIKADKLKDNVYTLKLFDRLPFTGEPYSYTIYKTD